MDVGSNSVILTVAEKTQTDWKPVLETTAVTALGEGTRSSGRLSERGIRDTLAALRNAFDAARNQGAQDITAAVTMAGRMASNSAELIERAATQNTPVSILGANDEAELGFLAVSEDPLFSGHTKISVVDIGGHSTELSTGFRENGSWKQEFCRSFDIGTLGLREATPKDGRSNPGDVLKLSRLIDEAIGMEYLPGQAGEAVSLGATGVNLASIRSGKPWSGCLWHGAELSFEEVARATGWLCSMDDDERGSIQGIEPGREKTLHLGALILERFLFALRVESCFVSSRGWRFGLLSHPIRSIPVKTKETRVLPA